MEYGRDTVGVVLHHLCGVRRCLRVFCIELDVSGHIRSGAELVLLEWVRAGDRDLFAGLGRHGQAAVTGLYSLVQHC